jgi:hypothetical protein
MTQTSSEVQGTFFFEVRSPSGTPQSYSIMLTVE